MDTEVSQHYSTVAGQLGSVEAYMATVPGTFQYPANRIRSQKAESTKVSRLSPYNDDESTSSEKYREEFEAEYASNS